MTQILQFLSSTCSGKRLSILNAKRRRIFFEKQKIVEAGWADRLDENMKQRFNIQDDFWLIVMLLAEFWLVLWTIVWNDL
jgi:hypothetical protein